MEAENNIIRYERFILNLRIIIGTIVINFRENIMKKIDMSNADSLRCDRDISNSKIERIKVLTRIKASDLEYFPWFQKIIKPIYIDNTVGHETKDEYIEEFKKAAYL